MDSETHFSIVFNIYGGSNQILPNATSATQNYYGDEAELEKDDVSKDKVTCFISRGYAPFLLYK